VRCGYVDMLPSAQYVDLEGPGIATDFGTPTEGCEVPWQQTTSSLVYDSTALTEQDTASVESLFAWAEANPGRFTYAAPPDFTGSMAVRTFFFDAAGGPDAFLEDFDEQAYEEAAPQLWERLNALEPALWREGSTYPADQGEVQALFAGDEIDAYLTYGSSAIGGLVEKGELPRRRAAPSSTPATSATTASRRSPTTPGTRGRDGARRPALSPEAALVNAGPEGAGFTSAIDLSRLPQEQAAEFGAAAAVAQPGAAGRPGRRDAARGQRRVRQPAREGLEGERPAAVSTPTSTPSRDCRRGPGRCCCCHRRWWSSSGCSSAAWRSASCSRSAGRRSSPRPG
jgi:putative spermidine/putrescine transport system substrate-binding protein